MCRDPRLCVCVLSCTSSTPLLPLVQDPHSATPLGGLVIEQCCAGRRPEVTVTNRKSWESHQQSSTVKCWQLCAVPWGPTSGCVSVAATSPSALCGVLTLRSDWWFLHHGDSSVSSSCHVLCHPLYLWQSTVFCMLPLWCSCVPSS